MARLLAPGRRLERVEGSASIRTWLYRIATNRSLDALRANARRPQHLEPLTDPPTPSRMTEPIWLEPYPDALIEGIADEAPGPEARYDQREALALAFVTGLRPLPGRSSGRSWSYATCSGFARPRLPRSWTQAKLP